MTTPDKLSRERLEYLRMGASERDAYPEGRVGSYFCEPEEERAMSAEILELREEVERLRRSQAHVRSLAPWPPVEVSSINPGPDGQIPQTPDPGIAALRTDVEDLSDDVVLLRAAFLGQAPQIADLLRRIEQLEELAHDHPVG